MPQREPELTPELTDEQKARLYDLARLPDDQIDTSDIPEIRNHAKVIRGLFYRPEKREINLSLDDFVIDWFQENSADAPDCHQYINNVLLEHIRQTRIRQQREFEARLIWQHSLWEAEAHTIRQAQERGPVGQESAGPGATP